MANNPIKLSETSPYPGITMVQDANKAFQSIATNFAGPTDPAANADAYMVWADTANGLIKRRNAANSGWVIEGSLFVRGIQSLTFAQIDDLTSDQGAIICTDMAGALYVWTSSAYFTGYRSVFCGKVEPGWTSAPFAWQKLATGGTWSDSDAKLKRLIARYQESSLVVTPANWKKGQNMIADLGSGDWKAPDLQDMFIRFTGTDADTANARALGSAQRDALQKITGVLNHGIQVGSIQSATQAFAANGSGTTPAAQQYPSGTPFPASFKFDSSLVTRASTETRGPNTALSPMIYL